MWHINFPKGAGSFRLDDASLREAELADEWESWQVLGMDKHSVVADPLFFDPEHDNYRLKPQSPALQLGFEPIPAQKIGPYQMHCVPRGLSSRPRAPRSKDWRLRAAFPRCDRITSLKRLRRPSLCWRGHLTRSSPLATKIVRLPLLIQGT